MMSSTDSVAASAPRQWHQCQRDFHHLKRFFAWLPTHVVQQTFSNSTQMGFMPSLPNGSVESLPAHDDSGVAGTTATAGDSSGDTHLEPIIEFSSEDNEDE